MLAASSTVKPIKGNAKGKTLDSESITIYLAFTASCGLVVQMFDGIGLSTLPTFSIALQVLGLGFLWLKIQKTRNVRGISAKSLQMQALVHGLRLCSTTWLKGYIPSDGTGDWLYQLMDALTLILCLLLTHMVMKKHKATYEAEWDDFDIKPVVVVCVCFAVLVHSDLDDRVFFDTLWAASLYIDVVAMMPQIWLMSKGGSVEGITGNYVAAIAVSRAANLVFWYFGFAELAPVDGGFNIAGWTILGAHVVQLLLLCDFMYYYIRGLFKHCASTASSACLAGGAQTQGEREPSPGAAESSTPPQLIENQVSEDPLGWQPEDAADTRTAAAVEV